MTDSKTLVTVEPEQLGMQIQDGRFSAKEITESFQLHVIEPDEDAEDSPPILFVEAEEIWIEIALHEADARAIIAGLEGMISDGE